MKTFRNSSRLTRRLAVVAVTASLLTTAACGSDSKDTASSGDSAVTIGIVELNLDNPFFGTLEKATESAATAKGWKVMKAEAKVAGDSATQVAAIENMIAQGVKAIVLDPANPTALNNVVKKARDKGIFVVTVNATLTPADGADATFATDNVAAGTLIGKWAKAKAPADPHIAMLDYDLSDGPASGRHDGFLAGYGITLDDPAIAGSGLTEGSIDTGQSAMENLLSANPDINVVYTINEPVARGAATALKNKGITDALIVSVDGACSGVQYVKDKVIGATAMQFPDKMGSMAVDSIAAFLKDGTKPATVLNDSGSTLITDSPVDGLASQTSDWGLEHCWGTKS